MFPSHAGEPAQRLANIRGACLGCPRCQCAVEYLAQYAAADARALNGAGVPRDVFAPGGFLRRLA